MRDNFISSAMIIKANEHIYLLGFARQDDPIILGLKPFHSILLRQAVGSPNMADFTTPMTNIHSRTTKYNVEIHSVYTNAWVVLNPQINVFLNSKTEVPI